MKSVASGLLFSWIRCGRINAEDWDAAEIPLGEGSEQYQIKILNGGGQTVRSTVSVIPEFTYLQSQRLADLGSISAPFAFKVRQQGALPQLGLEATLQVA